MVSEVQIRTTWSGPKNGINPVMHRPVLENAGLCNTTEYLKCVSVLITDHERGTREGNVFSHVCLSLWGEGSCTGTSRRRNIRERGQYEFLVPDNFPPTPPVGEIGRCEVVDTLRNALL